VAPEAKAQVETGCAHPGPQGLPGRQGEPGQRGPDGEAGTI